MVAIADIRQFETGVASVLNALDQALETAALAEDLPIVGNALASNASGATDALQTARTALLAGLQTLQDVTGHDISDIEDALRDALNAAGLGTLVSVSSTAGGFEVGLNLSQTARSTVALAADLGMPGLGLAVTGTADLEASATADFTLGFDTSGFYLDTTSEDLGLGLTVDNVFYGAAAQLGILSFTAADAGTGMSGTLDLDLTDADGKLRVGEAVNLAATLTAEADMRVDLGANFGSSALPSVSAVLDIDWDFVNATVTPYDQNISFGALPSIALEDVTLDLGTFLENVVLPVLDAVEPILEPLQIALDILTTDIEMLKLLPGWETVLDLTGDGNINLLDLIKLADGSIDLTPIEGFIDLASTVVDWAALITGMNLGEAGLNFGDFSLTGEDVRSDDFDIDGATIVTDMAGETLADALLGLSGGDWDGPDGGADILQQMVDGAAFALPILEDPGEVISLFFGGDADLIEVDFPEISLSAGSETLVNIPVFPGINVVIGGSIGFAFDLAFGYSTRGITQPGASLATALNGLYILDGDGAEASVSATINVGAALDAVVASIVGSGNITGTVNLDLADDLQTTPGRLYYDEFLTAATTNPFSLFDASGSITAGLSLAAKVLGGDIFRLDSPQITLAGFNFDGRAALPSSTDPLGLAALQGGALVLNIGALADNRLVGDASDTGEIVQITGTPMPGDVLLNINGYSGVYAHGSGIVADAGQGNDQIVLADTLALAATLTGGDGNDVLAGGALGDTLSGGDGDDTLFGRDGDDILNGDAGADLFYGGAGADSIDGGAGEDMVSYVQSGAGVAVNLTTGAGTGGTAQGDTLSSIEILQGSYHDDMLTGSALGEMLIGLTGDDTIFGMGGDDVILGSGGNDALDGGTGADILVGALGDDTYTVDDLGDEVDENRYGEIPVGSDGGTDTVIALIDWSIATGAQAGEIENLTLAGAAVIGTGNALDNVITANQSALPGGVLNGGLGNDTLIGSAVGERLDGGFGIDVMTGGLGDDTYIIDTLGDDIVETPGGGSDTAIVLMHTWALEAGDDIETLALATTVIGGDLTGNALDQTLIGAAGDDTLEGGDGADAYFGSDGTDRVTYRGASAGVNIDLTLTTQVGGAAEGDTYVSIEEIEGSAFADVLEGNAEDNVFFGLAGDDVLRGGEGKDTLWGGSGNDLLGGGTGADTLIGGDGDDIYVVDDAAEQVTELGTGTDLVRAWVDWSLDTPSQQNIENLTLFGAARIGTGNALANTITGTGGDDILDGLSGADTMLGGNGNDTYRVENSIDFITDTGGTDLIEMASTTGSYDMLAQAAEVENLTVSDNTGTVSVTGNALDNHIMSGLQADTLRGGDGNDILDAGLGGRALLYGDAGDDDLRLTYASLGSNYVYGGDGDADVMRLDWSAATNSTSWNDNSNGVYYRVFDNSFGNTYVYYDGIEAFDLTFGAGHDRLYGGDLDDRLHGGGGNDRLYAGRGAIDASGGTGSDLVNASLRTAEDVDLGLDFTLVLADTQSGTVTTNAGTAIESHWESIEIAQIYTGAGNDMLDTRGVASSTTTHGTSHYFASGAGDDHFASDYLTKAASGKNWFVAGDGYDKLTLDWGAASNAVSYQSNSNGTYFQVFDSGFGTMYQYFSNIEELDITTGSNHDTVIAMGGRDRFVMGGGNDKVSGADKGDSVHGGIGTDWASIDLRFDPATETDPAEDIVLNLVDGQTMEAVYFAGTDDETRVSGLETAWFYTGAGNDTYDARGITVTSNTHGRLHYFASGAGDDFYAVDYGSKGASGYAHFVAGDGYDRMVVDWGAANSAVTYENNSNGTYYRVFDGGFGYLYQYYSDIEELDITTGSASDTLVAIGGRDRFVTGAGNDKVSGADKGDTILMGEGTDWARIDLRFDPATETDPAEDIVLNLVDGQTMEAVYFAGTADETRVSGLETAWFYTGAGNDTYDARGITVTSNTHGRLHYFDAGAGNDFYAVDYGSKGASGYAHFVAGDGYDRMVIDWGAATNQVAYQDNSNGTYYRVFDSGFGYLYQYFSNIEEIDITTGSDADLLVAAGGRDRFVTGAGNDRVSGTDKGDIVLMGDGTDWASIDLRFGEGETDPGEDITLNLLDNQTNEAVWFAGTADETHVSGLELAWLYTGAGNDTYDARGVSQDSNTHGRSHYFASGSGDDHFATDYGSKAASGMASFVAGEGYDLLTLDWGDAADIVSYENNSNGRYYRVFDASFGYMYQYFSDIEELHLTTGSGADNVYAVGGRDRFVTQGGSDEIYGADKGDTIDAGSGTDWASLDLRFDPATETDPPEDITLNLLDNQISEAIWFAGTAEETRVQGLEQAWLYTGAGNDTFDTRGIVSSSSKHGKSNYFAGGDGDDHFLADYGFKGGADFDAGDGIDRLTLDWSGATSAIAYQNNSNGEYYRVFDNTFGYMYQYFRNVEAFTLTGGSAGDGLLGGALDDVLSGGGGSDTLTAGAGDDTLLGGDGNDALYGQDGNDLLVGGLGDDLLNGGDGIDTVSYADAGARVAVFLNRAPADLGSNQGIDTFVSIENVIGTDFDDRLVGNEFNNLLEGGLGNDVLIGNAGNDTLLGGDGDDELSGSGGDDTLEGGSGDDMLFGLGGADVLRGGSGNDLIEGGLGVDVIEGGADDDDIFGFFGVDTIDGGDGHDNIRADGSGDIVMGGAGNDRIVGGNGRDTLWGGSGNDILFGGGGHGNGDGLRDVFVFKSQANGGGGFDIIRDFEDTKDKIDLSESGYSSFDEVFADASQVGAHVEINFDFGGILRINNFLLTDLTEGDFLF